MTIEPGSKRKPRICMPSTRLIRRQVFRSGIYEAEDVLAEIDDVDLIELRPTASFQRYNRWQSRLVFRDLSDKLVELNPGLQRVSLKQDYDLFVAVCQDLRDIPYVNAIHGWKDRCKASVCWIDEIWAASIPTYRHWLSGLRKFDHVIIGSSSGSVDALSEAIGKQCYWVPLGVDTMRFKPRPNPAPRVLDVFSMGRVPDGIHEALRRTTTCSDMFYMHDTIAAANANVIDHQQHRGQLASLLQRSRYFVAAPAKFNAKQQTIDQIEFGPRYYEGTSAGAVLIGQAPDCSSFREMFNWPDAVIEVAPDGSDVVEVLQDLDRDPDRLSEISRRNVAQTLLLHDWSNRWEKILKISGLKPSRGMSERQLRLRNSPNLTGCQVENIRLSAISSG